MTNEELSLKCASVLGWRQVPNIYGAPCVVLPNGELWAASRIGESPAAVLAMICELLKHNVFFSLDEHHVNVVAARLIEDDLRYAGVAKIADHPTPEAALARCAMEAIVEVMG